MSATTYTMRALANPGPGYVTWQTVAPDYLGLLSPAPIQAGTAVVVSDTRGPYETDTFGSFEARPLVASASYSDLHLWSWTDETYPGVSGNTGSTDLTLEAYRDTLQIKAFFRHDQDNYLNIDYQMPHEWAQTPVNLHLHLIPTAATGGDAYFTGSFFFGNASDILPVVLSWTPIATVVPITAAERYVRKLSLISICPAPVTPSSSSILSIVMRREGTNLLDTYTGNKNHGTPAANLCLESYDIHYQRFLTGSEEQTSGVINANPARLFFNENWNAGRVYLQMVVKSDLGNPCSFRLYDVTAGAAVAGSDISVSSSSYTMVEVGPLTLAPGDREYIIQSKYDGLADEPKLTGARFILR